MKYFLKNTDFTKFILKFTEIKTNVLQFLFSRKALFVVSLLILSVFINLVFIFYPLQGQKWLSKVYKKSARRTLQVADGPLNNMDMRILKVRHKDEIYLEFLSKQPDDSYVEINSVKLKGNRDGYFEEQGGRVTALLLIDENGDGRLDVIAPTFDKFFIPRTNLVVYNERTNRFELKSEFAYPKTATPDFIVPEATPSDFIRY